MTFIEHIDKCPGKLNLYFVKELDNKTGIIFEGSCLANAVWWTSNKYAVMDFVPKMPFIHLLPVSVYNKIHVIFGENDSCIKKGIWI